MFAQDFALNRISVKGEVSNCKYHSSGHIYFTLKDGNSVLSAVMFKGSRFQGLKFHMEEGQKVIVTGSIQIYERDGKYQLYASQITLDGQGDLFARFEALKKELEEMGMFAPEYKKPLPRYAKRVGIVTAETGAAVRDIINVSRSRNPYIELILYPAKVQGEGAALTIVKGIQILDSMKPDVIIVGRGGGSIEDLWAFNEEIVARAIFACETPVISAVGHETDSTIADFVADMRASTPSHAAELAVYDYFEFERSLNLAMNRLKLQMMGKLRLKKEELNSRRLKLRYLHPMTRINEQKKRVADAEEYMAMLIERKLRRERHRLEVMAEKLEGNSPLKKLAPGYGFVTDSEGKRLGDIDSVSVGDEIGIRMRDAMIKAEIRDIKKH